MQIRTEPEPILVPKTPTIDPFFSGKQEAGVAALAPPATSDSASMVDPSPQVVHVLVDVADLDTLADYGGAEEVGEILREEIERHGLARALSILRTTPPFSHGGVA